MRQSLRVSLAVILSAFSAQVLVAQFQFTYEHLASDDHTSLSKSLSGAGYVQASTIANATRDIHLMKFDAAGTAILDVTFKSPSADERALHIVRGNNNNYIVCGFERVGSLDIGFVMSVDTSFNLLAKTYIQTIANNRHTPVLNVINSAYYDKPTFGTYWPGDTNGGYLLTGFEAVGYNPTDSKSAFAIKVDDNLNFQWARKFDSPISPGTPDWDMASHGNWMWVGNIGYMVGGSGTAPTGEQAGFAAALSPSGAVVWSKLYSDNNSSGTFCVAADGAYDDAVFEVYQLSNFSQTQSAGIIAFNQLTGAINMARTRYLVASTPDYYGYEFASTCASTEILISGYGLNQTSGSTSGIFPYTIRYNKNNPLVDTWWQHYAYPVQSANYNPSGTIFDTFSTSEQPRIFYPKLFASRLVNEITLSGFKDNLTFDETHLIHPYFDGKDSCEYVDPQIVALPMPIHEWPVNNVTTTYNLPPDSYTQNILSNNPVSCNACVSDATFTTTPGNNCTYTFTANNPGNICSLFTITDISNNVIVSVPANTLTFTFSLNGTYTVCYADCNIDNNGTVCRDEKCQTITVNCPPCTVDADFSYSISGCCVNFTDLTPDGDPNQCEKWIFGNISSSITADFASFCFPGSGTYTVCHIDCCYDAGTTNPTYHQVCKQVTVSCAPPCCLPNNINIAVNNCCITATALFPTSGCGALYYLWNFGDGNISTSPNPTHCYSGSGVYNVCLTAYCSKGNKIKICRRVKILCAVVNPGGGGGSGTGASAKIGFSYSGTQAHFTDASQLGSSYAISSRTWNFGDGYTSSEANPVHFYAVSGTYPVSLTLQGTNLLSGESFTISQEQEITLVLNPACGCAPPQTSAFASAQSVCTSGGSVSLHLIDFDGEADVTHQWQSAPGICSDADCAFTDIPGIQGQQTWVHGISGATSFRCVSRANTTGLVTYSDIVHVGYAPQDASLSASYPTPGATSLCSGETVTLEVTAPGANEFIWEPSVSSSSFATDSPTSDTFYSVEVGNESGCGALAALDVHVLPVISWCLDSDGDGYYTDVASACLPPAEGWVALDASLQPGDCNDSQPNIHPGAPEICGNAVDENCDGVVPGNFTISGPNPGSQTICTGVPGPTFTVSVTGTGSYSYQWFANGVNNNFSGTSQGAVNGAQTASYSPNASANPSATYFYCVVTEVGSGCPGTASSTAMRTVVNCSAPANDARAAAIPLNSHTMGACITSSGNLTNATVSPEAQTSLPAGGQDLWYRFVANSPGIRIQVATSAFNAFIELLDASGAVLATENALSGSGGEILNHFSPGSPLVTGQTYFIAVRNVNTAPLSNATFTICLQRIQGTTCNSNSANTCGLLQAVPVGAQGYTFAFTSTSSLPPLGALHSVTLNTAGGFTSVPLSGLIPAVQYTASITANYNLFDAAGTPENFLVPTTALCTFTMQQHAGVFLRDADDCPETVSSTRVIGANVWVCGASYYQWTFTPSVGSPITVSGNPGNRFLAMSAAVAAGVTPGSYEVTIQPFFASGQVPSSATPASRCLILAGPGSMAAEEVDASAAPVLRSTSGPQAAVALYPNPFDGELITLNATGLTAEALQVRILDGTGRVVWSTRFAVEGSLRAVVAFDRPLTSGIYVVEISSNGFLETQRLVVQR